MIEFDVIYDCQFRKVVHELRTLIEVGCVVLICFDDYVIAVRNSETGTKILGDSTNQKTWIESSLVHYPRRDTGRGGLSMCTSNRKTLFAANEFFFDDLSL